MKPCKILLKLSGPERTYYEKVTKDVTSSPPDLLVVGTEIDTEAGPAIIKSVGFQDMKPTAIVWAEIVLKDMSRVNQLQESEWHNLP